MKDAINSQYVNFFFLLLPLCVSCDVYATLENKIEMNETKLTTWEKVHVGKLKKTCANYIGICW